MEQRHVIKRQVIELTVQNRATAPALQDKVSSVYRQRIVPLIERYCSELGQPDRLYRIDSLELDLGVLNVDGDIEGEFVARAETALRTALSAQITGQEAEAAQPGRNPRTQSALELFTFFLQTGSLPWWADDAQPDLLADTLRHLLDEPPDELRRLLQSLTLDEDLQRRLVTQFDDGQLAGMAALFIPSLQASFAQDARALKNVLEKTKVGVATSPTFLRQRLWTRILQVSSLGGSQLSSLQAFYRAVLQRVAADLGMTPANLMAEIRQVLQDHGRTGGSRGFKTLLQTLNAPAAETSAPASSHSELARRLERLRVASAGELAAAWAALLALNPRLLPGALAVWLQALDVSNSRDAAQNVLHLLDGDLAQQGLSPTESSRLTGLFRAALDALDQQPQDDEKLDALLRRYQSQGGPLAGAWTELWTLRAKLSTAALAAWLDALNVANSRDAAQNVLRLLDGDVAQLGLLPAESSRLSDLFRAALGVLDQQPRDTEKLDALLWRYQSQGGPLAGAWAELRALSAKLSAIAWLEALDAPDGQRAARNVLRLLSGKAEQHGLTPDEQTRLTALLQPALESAMDESAVSGDELDALLRRHQSQGGPLAEAWGMLRAWLARLPLQAQAAWLDALDAPDSASAAASAIRLLNAGAAQHGLRSNDRIALLGMLRAAVAPPSLSAKFSKIGSGEADELAVANAGLVILWPFLASFFTHLELVEARQFKDLSARQRGVGLLQFLAAGQIDPPEYLLPLNKLLCGLEVRHVFDFGPPLRKAEKKECNRLIEAVIAQAPILHNMSPDGFRGSFLLRRGQLSLRDGLWLLRVERQTYDVVLERFPWSWQWVKLPWMETPLQVEWQFT